MSYETYAHAQALIEVGQLSSISMKGVKREIKVFSALNQIERVNKKKRPSEKLKNVPERIGDRLDALETKIEEILGRIKWIKNASRTNNEIKVPGACFGLDDKSACWIIIFGEKRVKRAWSLKN